MSMGTLLAFTLACIGIVILRRTSPSLERPFRTPGMPWVPVLGALTCVDPNGWLAVGNVGAPRHLARGRHGGVRRVWPPHAVARERTRIPQRADTRRLVGVGEACRDLTHGQQS